MAPGVNAAESRNMLACKMRQLTAGRPVDKKAMLTGAIVDGVNGRAGQCGWEPSWTARRAGSAMSLGFSIDGRHYW